MTNDALGDLIGRIGCQRREALERDKFEKIEIGILGATVPSILRPRLARMQRIPNPKRRNVSVRRHPGVFAIAF